MQEKHDEESRITQQPGTVYLSCNCFAKSIQRSSGTKPAFCAAALSSRIKGKQTLRLLKPPMVGFLWIGFTNEKTQATSTERSMDKLAPSFLTHLLTCVLIRLRLPRAGLSEKPKEPGQVSVSGGPRCKVGGQQDSQHETRVAVSNRTT